MEKIKLTVTGMSCAHCEKAVINALQDIGAANVAASAEGNFVEVEFDPATLTRQAIVDEIVDCGYVVNP